MNITLSVDEQTVEKARRMAQAMHKSLNQLGRANGPVESLDMEAIKREARRRHSRGG